MKKMIPILIIISAIITIVLFFINIKIKDGLFFYNLGFTILFEALFIIWFGVSADYKEMNKTIKILFFLFIIVSSAVQFVTLFLGYNIFKIKPMTSIFTTILLIQTGVEIIICFIMFAVGNLFSKK